MSIIMKYAGTFMTLGDKAQFFVELMPENTSAQELHRRLTELQDAVAEAKLHVSQELES